jgi:streptogramin lyase
MNFTAQTPNLPALDYTCITLSGNFSASKNTSWPFFQPIFTGGPAYRWLSMVLLSIDGQTSELVVFLNNQTINFHTGKIIEFDKWYHLAASIDLNVKLLRIFLDGKRILNIDLPPDFQLEVVHDNVMYDKIITLENYSNGTAFKGLMNNLQIYNRAIWTIPVIRDISQNQQPVSLGPVDITLVGANFQPGSSILVSSNPSVATISTYSVNSDSRINARITPVAPGTTTFRVANPDGGIGASGAFLVTLQPTTWTVTPGVNGGNGTISPNAPQTVANGGSVQFTAMPVSSDYGVDQWYKAGVSVQTGGTTYTDSNVSGSHPVQVSFKAKPVIQSFRVSPNLIPIGAGGVLAWTVTGASLLSVDQNIGALPSPTGTKNVAPTVTTTYTLTATNVAGSSTAMATLTVDATPFKITGFTASPTVVPFGGSSMLAWTFTGLPTNLTVNGAPVGGLTTTVSPQRRQHFTLAGSNGAGSDSLTVKVAAQGIDLVAGDINGFGAMDGQGDAARFGHMTGTAMDAAGNILVADGRNHTIRKVTPTGIVSTLAGSSGMSGFIDGPADVARFNYPSGLGFDTAGNLYVSDQGNNAVRIINPAGVVSTLAGGGFGYQDGTGRSARFASPYGLAVDRSGNVYVADSYNQVIRKITSAGAVSTLAGMPGSTGYADGTGNSATFDYPEGIAVDMVGNVFVADQMNHVVRKITPAGLVSTYAGVPGQPGSSDGAAQQARFCYPFGVAVDASGNVYVADTTNCVIRTITPAGVVSTIAGGPGNGFADGPRGVAKFMYPESLVLDLAGNAYVADSDNACLRKVTSGGIVSTLAGKAGRAGHADGTGSAATFYGPQGVAVDPKGTIYVADCGYSIIRRIDSDAHVTTFAGSPGSVGSLDGSGANARFFGPVGVVADGNGNLFIADRENHCIRKITPAGAVTTLAGKPGVSGYSDGNGSAATFCYPIGVAVDGVGNIYVADLNNSAIRKITPGGVVTTFAGTPGAWGLVDGPGGTAKFWGPSAVAVDQSGNVYVADTFNQAIRKITPGGIVSTLAGSHDQIGYIDGLGDNARFNYPMGVAVDPVGNVYVTDSSNHTIRKITPAGLVTTLAGTHGQATFIPGNLPGYLVDPIGIAITPDGDLVVSSNDGIIQITAPYQVPVISSFTANPTSIGLGQSSALSWNVSGATSLTIDNGVGAVSPVTAGSKSVSPATTTTYTLTATNLAGNVTQTVTLNVVPNPVLPVINSLTANPTSIGLGQSSALSWNVSGATSLTIDNGVGAVSPVMAGSKSVSPATTTTYTLTATNLAGNVTQTVTVNVVPNQPLTVSMGVGTTGSPSSSQSFPYGTVVNYSYSLLAGGTYLVVQVDGVTVSDSGSLTMNQAHTITASATAPPPGTIIEFKIPTAGSDPWYVSPGPDGNLWFTEYLKGIVRITPAGVTTEFPTPGVIAPFQITSGPGGNLWFIDAGDKVGRITPVGAITLFSTPTASGHPWGITSGPDGNLWFTELGNKIGRITPAGVITEFLVPTVGSSPTGITSGPEGNLWFTETAGNKIGRITPAGVITEFPIPTAGSNPIGITSGPDGNLWFTELDGNKIGRITPSGVITEFLIPTAASYTNEITAGPDGNIWFTEAAGNKIGRITPAGVITEFPIPTPDSWPWGIASGPDGNLWFTERGGDKVGRIRP